MPGAYVEHASSVIDQPLFWGHVAVHLSVSGTQIVLSRSVLGSHLYISAEHIQMSLDPP